MTLLEAIEIARSLTPDDHIFDENSVCVEKLYEPTGDPGVDFILGVGLFDEPRITWNAFKGLNRIIFANV